MVSTKNDAGGPSRGLKEWVHRPSKVIILWLVVSLPLVLWDTSYVFLRPHSMPGGSLHYLWKPYGLYGTVDYIYGWPAYNSHNGFTAAQSAMNIVETVFYIWYLWLIYAFGERGVIPGKVAGVAVLVVFSSAVMTLSKTLLYWLNEYFSGFQNIGHNSLPSLVTLWIIPNGLWIVLPMYMIYTVVEEILSGLSMAASTSENSSEGKKGK